MSDTYAGIAQPSDYGSHYNVYQFISRMVRNEMWTSTIAKVIAVDTDAKTVDIIPDVNQIDGSGNPWPHQTIHGCPYMYWQGGSNSVQIDPAVGDHGAVIFASHDISSVIANSGQSNPGSFRRFDPSDGMYLGALPGLNPDPTQTITFSDGTIEITAVNVIVDGNLTVTQNVSAGDGISATFTTPTGQTATFSNGILIGLS